MYSFFPVRPIAKLVRSSMVYAVAKLGCFEKKIIFYKCSPCASRRGKSIKNLEKYTRRLKCFSCKLAFKIFLSVLVKWCNFHSKLKALKLLSKNAYMSLFSLE